MDKKKPGTLSKVLIKYDIVLAIVTFFFAFLLFRLPNFIIDVYFSTDLVEDQLEKIDLEEETNVEQANIDFDVLYDKVVRRSKIISGVTIIISAAFLTVVIILYTMKIMKMVVRPLKILEKEMEEPKVYDNEELIKYKGPAEFEHVLLSFNDMKKRLSESERQRKLADEEKQRMLTDISHDLKTPAAVIKGYSGALLDDMVPEEKKTQYLKTISRKADNLSDLINTFYEYSRLEHPDFVINKKHENLSEFLRVYFAEKYEDLTLSGFELESDIPEKEIYADFDSFQMKRVFDNIIGNSINHNGEGTCIYVSLEEKDNKNIILVGDDGVGIPEDMREAIFEPFVVGDESRTEGYGSGLGLAIVKKIVEMHGGTVALEDEKEGLRWKTLYKIEF